MDELTKTRDINHHQLFSVWNNIADIFETRLNHYGVRYSLRSLLNDGVRFEMTDDTSIRCLFLNFLDITNEFLSNHSVVVRIQYNTGYCIIDLE